MLNFPAVELMFFIAIPALSGRYTYVSSTISFQFLWDACDLLSTETLKMKLSVAIHESQIRERIEFNIHTGFVVRGVVVPLARCSKDEQSVLHEIESTLQSDLEAIPP